MATEGVVRTFRVDSIHCDGCEARIRDRLGVVDGVLEVHPDQHTDQVRIRYDPERIDGDRLPARLSEAGFPVVARVSEGVEHPPAEPLREKAGPAAVGESHELETKQSGRDAKGAEERGRAGHYGVLVAALLLVALAGYTGYVLYPRFDLPRLEGAGVLALAAAAGIASFFSPCSFPLLLGLLGRRAVAQGGRPRQDGARPAVFGAALASGAGAFLLLAGVVIALGGEALFAGVVFDSPAGIAIRSIVGALLIVLGLIQIGVLPVPMDTVSKAARPLTRRHARLRRRHPAAGFAVFGLGYVLAGFG
jgi:cytochrome c biogenesis protein CcdA/copper chaperone CopZ